jgi:hypothetical protein
VPAKVRLWRIADDVLLALKVRYEVGCPAATSLGERPESAHRGHLGYRIEGRFAI